MIIDDFTVLRSLRNEAERQGHFYSARHQDLLASFWNELASETQVALQSAGRRWELILRDCFSNPIPIKACEQHQQPSNNKVIKALQ